MEPLRARYRLLVDNLLDLSHETYLHGGYIGTPEVVAAVSLVVHADGAQPTALAPLVQTAARALGPGL